MVGHFHSMAPLARAAGASGHQVAFATGKSFGAAVRGAGFQHFPCGVDFEGTIDILSTLPGWETIREKTPPGAVQQLYGFAEGLAPRMADDLIDLVDAWRPDVIVRDPVEFGGYVAAERAGLPHASIMWALYIDAWLAVPDALLALRARYGLPADPGLSTIDRYLMLDFLPASWTFPNWPPPRVTHRFCAPPFDVSGDEGLPDWLAALPAQPTVYATLGTTFNQAPAVFQAIVDAMRDEDANLILTVGRSMDPAQFQVPAGHIRVARYLPQTRLLAHCDAVIFHGGYNTLLAALWHGLPMVVIPQQAGDQFPTAQRCAGVGVGVLVEGTPPAPEAVRAAVRSVLEQPAYRARARELQREMQALPPLAEAVRRLESLATTREPQPNV
jgi:UDP:flavonoid glycosyltransferase YjiC (YdhE family)